ncbi:hypothetical protein P20439_2174 [Pseudoalteromonas sp. BSi20439]|nr:hypothetical protein P20439_2174 [Pseudoalteromonas sp. BSi20439]
MGKTNLTNPRISTNAPNIIKLANKTQPTIKPFNQLGNHFFSHNC